MTDIIIQGAMGRMGKVLSEMLSSRENCRVVAGIDMNIPTKSAFPIYGKLADVKECADVLIDFSLPKACMESLQTNKEKKIPFVICTTGFSVEELELIEQLSQTMPIFHSGNMSLGINLMQSLIVKAQSVLQGFDIEIVEKHHRNKLDAPSGTALMLANSLNEAADNKYSYVYDREKERKARSDNEIGISAIRGGSIVGEHEVIFAGPDEVISITHTAFSRNVFATGAISAALFMKGKQAGLYNMSDVLNAV